MFPYSENITDGTEHLRRLSKLLLGNADRIQVAAAVSHAEPGELYSRALADALRWPDGRVQKQLKQFEEAGLLVMLPSVGGERRVYYERKESAFWDCAAAMEREWRERTQSTRDRRADRGQGAAASATER